MGENSNRLDAAESAKFRIYRCIDDKQTMQRGPLIEATWSILPELELLYSDAGKAVPDPITGLMLVDTGAGPIAIGNDVAAELGLELIGREEGVHTPGAEHIFPIYANQ